MLLIACIHAFLQPAVSQVTLTTVPRNSPNFAHVITSKQGANRPSPLIKRSESAGFLVSARITEVSQSPMLWQKVSILLTLLSVSKMCIMTLTAWKYACDFGNWQILTRFTVVCYAAAYTLPTGNGQLECS